MYRSQANFGDKGNTARRNIPYKIFPTSALGLSYFCLSKDKTVKSYSHLKH